MPRRGKHTKEEIIALAVQAGSDLIKDEGLIGFSSRKVAKKIGYTVGMLYHVIEDQNNMMLLINARTLEDLTSYILENLSENYSGVNALEQIAGLYIDFAAKNYNRWAAIFEYSMPLDYNLPEWYLSIIKQVFLIVAGRIVQLCNSDSDEAIRAAKLLWSAVHGVTILALSKKLFVVSLANEGSFNKNIQEVKLLAHDLIRNYVKGKFLDSDVKK